MKRTLAWTLLPILLISHSVAADPATPDWTHHSQRRVIGGDIIQWGTGEASTAELALFKAQHMAIRSLIEECGGISSKNIVPRRQHFYGVGATYRAYANVSLDFSSCEHAKSEEARKDPTKIENPVIAEGQKLYLSLLLASSGAASDSSGVKMEDLGRLEEKVREFLKEQADWHSGQLDSLQLQIDELREGGSRTGGTVTRNRFETRDTESNAKEMCWHQYRTHMDQAIQAAAPHYGNMAAPDAVPSFNRAMSTRVMCEKMR